MDNKHSFYISVVVCTHNPDKFILERVLQSLGEQTLSKDKWHLIVVDNLSSEKLESNILDGLGCANVELIYEDEVGLINARIAGINKSHGDVIVFVDDDNFLEKDYLDNVYRYLTDIKYLNIGVMGGLIEGEYEASPSDWLLPVINHLAIRKGDLDECISSSPSASFLEPIGAGMCVRRAVAEEFVIYVNENMQASLLGRKGTNLSGCEDTLMAYVSYICGYKNMYTPYLKLYHYIPKFRLSFSYNIKLAYSLGASYAKLLLLLMPNTTRNNKVRLLVELIVHFIRLRNEPYMKTRILKWVWMFGYVNNSHSLWTEMNILCGEV